MHIISVEPIKLVLLRTQVHSPHDLFFLLNKHLSIFFSPEWNSLEHRPCPRLLFTSNSCGISHCVIIVLEEPISRAKGGVPCLVLSYVELCFIWLNSKMNSWLIPFFSQNINIVQSLCPYLFPPMCYFFFNTYHF